MAWDDTKNPGDSWTTSEHNTMVGVINANTAKTGVTDQISNVIEDTTPQLGGDLDADGNSITDAKVVHFEGEFDNGNSGASITIDFTAAQKQRVTLNNDSTLSFTAPSGAANVMLKIIQDGIGSRVLTLPTIKWAGGTEPTWTTASNSEDLIALYYDGTSWYGTASLDMQ